MKKIPLSSAIPGSEIEALPREASEIIQRFLKGVPCGVTFRTYPHKRFPGETQEAVVESAAWHLLWGGGTALLPLSVVEAALDKSFPREPLVVSAMDGICRELHGFMSDSAKKKWPEDRRYFTANLKSEKGVVHISGVAAGWTSPGQYEGPRVLHAYMRIGRVPILLFDRYRSPEATEIGMYACKEVRRLLKSGNLLRHYPEKRQAAEAALERIEAAFRTWGQALESSQSVRFLSLKRIEEDEISRAESEIRKAESEKRNSESEKRNSENGNPESENELPESENNYVPDPPIDLRCKTFPELKTCKKIPESDDTYIWQDPVLPQNGPVRLDTTSKEERLARAYGAYLPGEKAVEEAFRKLRETVNSAISVDPNADIEWKKTALKTGRTVEADEELKRLQFELDHGVIGSAEYIARATDALKKMREEEGELKSDPSLVSSEIPDFESAPDKVAPGLPEGWDARYLGLAKHIAQWSKDPSTKVGAVLVRPDKTIASLGFNGFPRGVEDRPDLLENREEKYRRVVHAEMNAILSCRDPSMEGYTLYTWPLPPCSNCAAMVIQAGVKRIVAPKQAPDRWSDATRVAHDMFSEAGVKVTYY